MASPVKPHPQGRWVPCRVGETEPKTQNRCPASSFNTQAPHLSTTHSGGSVTIRELLVKSDGPPKWNFANEALCQTYPNVMPVTRIFFYLDFFRNVPDLTSATHLHLLSLAICHQTCDFLRQLLLARV